MEKQILKVDNLSVTLDHAQILKNISFALKEKDVLIVLGPNGAGKTILLRALLGLVPHTGTVTWYEHKISYLPPQERINKQYLLPLTVAEFLSLKNISEEKISHIMKEVGLDAQLKNHQIKTLSTGEFQRMLIAWALSSDPHVLVLDEPTTGIDIGGEETIYSLLHRLWKEKNLTIILVTHHIHVVWEHATNVLCINKEKLCYGKPEIMLTKENLEKMYGIGAKMYEHRHNTK
ncbi:metal ABC transporter ATP-binding protein [Candidatus Dependentiae bacterium]